MTVYTYEHFMRLGKQHNCSAEIRSAYFNLLEFYPQHEDGQYVLICEECGQASYTKNFNKRFCSQHCRRIHNARMLNPQLTLTKHFDHYEVIPEHPTTKPPMGIVHRYCEHCGKRFAVYASHVRQGSSLYCSRSCSDKNRDLKPLTYICNNCGEEFRAVSAINAVFCSTECKQNFKVINQTSHFPPRILKDSHINFEIEKDNFLKIKITKESIKNEFISKNVDKKLMRRSFLPLSNVSIKEDKLSITMNKISEKNFFLRAERPYYKEVKK